MLLLIIAFFAGILTILAPCVLPVLPVIIGGSISGGKKDKYRPYVIGASLAISIIFFTLILKFSTYLIGLSPSVLGWLSGGLLVLLGIVALWPELWEKFVIWLNWQAASQRFLGKGEQNKDQYIGPILIGVALGPVFASCSPTYAFILASVLPISFLAGLIYLIAYSLGLAAALLLISIGGKRIINKYSWAVDTHSLFRRSLGLLFIIIGVAIISGYQIRAETWVANHLPFDESRIERVLLAKQQKSHLINKLSNSVARASVLNVQSTAAPELQGLTNWINSPPLSLQQLHGKVVLVDFWTFSCINCIRSIPFVESWYQNYKDAGLVIIGVNTPEFAFEHDPANVAAAVKQDGITYPVTLDNNYQTWNAFQNNSWPADYLIDKSGNIRYVSLGEGDYDKTEQAIQVLLGVNKSLKTAAYSVPITSSQTPETYFGTNRAMNYTGSPTLGGGTFDFQAANSLASNNWTLGGGWSISPEYITSNDANATLHFNVTAKNVYVVAGTTNNQPAQVGVGLPTAQAGQYGSDVSNGKVNISGSRLYHIVSLNQVGSTTVTLTVPKNVSLYTFTFGS
ncbi:MAG TPA: redoxin family protein [Candidatus Saccharimonadales bacterium]|jgi:cytochrome c biogenesis protein CcdA/thiol-disulfide isomerase/thioredoxin|nr:redoxin family protein [Candidatus Saccharimonadales bacterium]